MPVYYHHHNINYSLKNAEKVSSWIETVFHSESNKHLLLSFIFCNDSYLLEINQKYLHHDTLTDVIAFSLEESDSFLESEIYISIDRVKENAAEYGNPPDEELMRVMVHGVLHLLGYTDKTPLGKSKMKDLEDRWLSAYQDDQLG